MIESTTSMEEEKRDLEMGMGMEMRIVIVMEMEDGMVDMMEEEAALDLWGEVEGVADEVKETIIFI